MRPAFSVALLMGGRSRRMGADKSMLPHPSTGRPGWERQVALLDSLGPSQRFLSLRVGQRHPPLEPGWQCIVDVEANAGPLGGISACLEALGEEALLILAVDLLGMTKEPLQYLLDQCRAGGGAVYRRDGFYEPLAAAYPKRGAESATAYLGRGGRKLQTWVGQAVDAGWMRALAVPSNHERAFANVNDPAAYGDLTR